MTRRALWVARLVAVLASVPAGLLAASIADFLFFGYASRSEITRLRVICSVVMCLLLSFRLWSSDAAMNGSISRFYVMLGSLTIGAVAGLTSGILIFFGPALADRDLLLWWGWAGGMLALPVGLLVGWAGALGSHALLSKRFNAG